MMTLVVGALAACLATTPSVDPDSAARALYGQGQTFKEFLAAATARRDGWLRLRDSAVVSPALIQRARAVGGSWQFLVVAIDRCGDSMNSVPYLAALADSVPSVSLRIVPPTTGRPVQEGYRSLDGRTATPTIVLLGADGRAAGCIVELPRELRDWSHAARTRKVPLDSIHEHQRGWYASNRGVGISTELVELLEAASSGTPSCARGRAP
jgi:hypothetical protein